LLQGQDESSVRLCTCISQPVCAIKTLRLAALSINWLQPISSLVSNGRRQLAVMASFSFLFPLVYTLLLLPPLGAHTRVSFARPAAPWQYSHSSLLHMNVFFFFPKALGLVIQALGFAFFCACLLFRAKSTWGASPSPQGPPG